MIDAARPDRTHILCIGMPVRDLAFRVAAVPPHGAKVPASEFTEIAGGNALNAAVGIVRLGGRAALAGPMGDAGETATPFLLDTLAGEGIDSRHLVHMPGLVTPISAVMIDESGERTIVTFRDPALWKVRLPDTDTLLDGCGAVMLEGRSSPFVHDLCAEARRRDIPIVVDVDSELSPGDSLLTVASHLVFSHEALRRTAGIDDDVEALRKLARQTSSFLAATRGSEGTVWLDAAGATRETPAFPVDVVDTLGAGDIFHGAFALALTEGQTIPAVLRFASAAAALKCTRFGGAFACPHRAEVEAFLAAHPSVPDLPD